MPIRMAHLPQGRLETWFRHPKLRRGHLTKLATARVKRRARCSWKTLVSPIGRMFYRINSRTKSLGARVRKGSRKPRRPRSTYSGWSLTLQAVFHLRGLIPKLSTTSTRYVTTFLHSLVTMTGSYLQTRHKTRKRRRRATAKTRPGQRWTRAPWHFREASAAAPSPALRATNHNPFFCLKEVKHLTVKRVLEPSERVASLVFLPRLKSSSPGILSSQKSTTSATTASS